MIRTARQLLRARRGASTAVALFVVVWLNMALQPCLMAAETMLPDEQQHDCPHCPEPANHCDENTGRCAYVGQFEYDGRSPEMPELPVLLMSAPAPQVWMAPDARSRPAYAAHSVLARAGPRLHARNCVYLN